MTDVVSRGGLEPTLGFGAPAYTAMQECLRVQSEATQRGWFARAVGSSPLLPDARHWFHEALREREVAHILAELGPNWSVLREAEAVGVAGGAQNGVDHVVIGPPGIIAITASQIDGRRIRATGLSLQVDGEETDLIRKTMGSATRAERLLSGSARTSVVAVPLLVVVGATSIRRGKPQPSISVIGAAGLRRWFLDRARTISDETVDYFTTVALRSGRWNSQRAIAGDVVRRVQRFERLQAEIADARSRFARVIIGLSLALVLAAAVVLAPLAR